MVDSLVGAGGVDVPVTMIPGPELGLDLDLVATPLLLAAGGLCKEIY